MFGHAVKEGEEFVGGGGGDQGNAELLEAGEVFEIAAVIFAHLEDGSVLALEVDGDNTASTTRKPTAARAISRFRYLTDEVI